MNDYTMSPATSLLLDVSGIQRDKGLDPLTLASAITAMTHRVPECRLARREIMQRMEVGIQPDTDAACLLALIDAAGAFHAAQAAFMDAVFDASDCLQGEGLPGIHLP